MNTDNQLAQLLKFLTETLQQGKDFTIEQAPQFVKELLMWRYTEALYFCALGATLVLASWVIAAFLTRRIAKEKAASKSGYSGLDGGNWMVAIGGTVVGALIIGMNLYTAVQVKVAPRVVVVEMVRSLIAGQVSR